MQRTLLLCALTTLALAGACSTQSPSQPDPARANPVGDTSAAGVVGSLSASEQVVFSGVAFLSSTFPQGTPAGFWIWCEAESANPYNGVCQGAMYFYALGITKHIGGTVAETPPDSGLYQMTVSSRDGSVVTCRLNNTAPAVSGPNNLVQVSCATPSGSAASPNAVVNVTGP